MLITPLFTKAKYDFLHSQIVALMYSDRLKLAVLKRERNESQGSQSLESGEKESFSKPPDWNNVVQKYLEVHHRTLVCVLSTL